MSGKGASTSSNNNHILPQTQDLYRKSQNSLDEIIVETSEHVPAPATKAKKQSVLAKSLLVQQQAINSILIPREDQP